MINAGQFYLDALNGSGLGCRDMAAIQIDALEHAAHECRRRKKNITRFPDKLQDAYNIACEECAIFILAEAERIKEEYNIK